MNKSTIATILLTVGGLVGLAPSIATGQTQSGLNIADNDSVYVDGKSFQVIPGKAKGDATVQIKNLAARDLGPAAIILRSGNKLYIADAQGQMAQAQAQTAGAAPNYAYDPKGYYYPALRDGGSGSEGYNGQLAQHAYDPQAYNPALRGGGSGSEGYNGQLAQHAYDPQAYNPVLRGGGSEGYNWQLAQHAYDPRAYSPALLGGGSEGYNDMVAHDYAYDPHRLAQPAIIYDPDYVEYRLKKAFEDNWTPMAAATSTK
jgi:hypothetical protein